MFRRYIKEQVKILVDEEMDAIRKDVELIKKETILRTKDAVIKDLLTAISSKYNKIMTDEGQELKRLVEIQLWDQMNEKLKEEIPKLVKDRVNTENFIDDVVSRIKSKQL